MVEFGLQKCWNFRCSYCVDSPLVFVDIRKIIEEFPNNNFWAATSLCILCILCYVGFDGPISLLSTCG